MPAKLSHRFRLKPNALDTMAVAIGDDAYWGGRPTAAIMLGASARTTASRMLAGVHEPSSDSVATIAKRHATNRNIPWEQALGELFDIVEVARDSHEPDDGALLDIAEAAR